MVERGEGRGEEPRDKAVRYAPEIDGAGGDRTIVPIVVGTVLPLAVHPARRRLFFASERWVPAAGLLGALSFPSGDRNFDYFPGDRLTSKKNLSFFSRPRVYTGRKQQRSTNISRSASARVCIRMRAWYEYEQVCRATLRAYYRIVASREPATAAYPRYPRSTKRRRCVR